MSSQSFGKYELVRKLATGGMAEVWLARQTGIEGFQRQLVIKRILPHLAEDADFVRMFLNEAKISAKFSHPNIGQIFDLGQIDGTYYIAMEFIHGEDLGRVMRKAWSTGQWISRPLGIRIVASACEALAYAHAKVDERGRPLQVVHRDISPQNLLLSFDGAVKLVDFGIAKAADATAMTKSGAIKGKFAYMSPEQAGGKPLDHRTDIFAIGLVLYELLTGVRPLKRDSELATLQAALACDIDPPSQVADVPPELDGVVMRALARNVQDRYEDARQFQQGLEEFLVAQRWVVGSVQLAELMRTLFADRLNAEARGEDFPRSTSSQNNSPAEGAHASRPPPPVPGGSGQKGGPVTSPGGRHPSELSWDAPPGASNPQGRRANSLPPAPAPTSPRVSDATARELHGTQAARPPPRPKPPPPRTRLRPEPAAEDDLPDEPPTAPLRRTSSLLMPAYEKGMPEAPPRRSVVRPSVPAREEASADSDERLAPERSAMGRLTALGTAVRAAGLVAVVGGMAAVAAVTWNPVLKPWVTRLTSKPAGLQGQPIFITAVSNLPGQVYVVHAEKDAPEARTALGELPLAHASGAHVGDTIIIENRAMGARYVQPVKFGEPGEVKSIRKEFKTGRVLLNLRNAPPHGLAIYLAGERVAVYEPNLSFEMVEGEYDLEVRGDALRQAVPVHVRVVGDRMERPPAIDLRPYLHKA